MSSHVQPRRSSIAQAAPYGCALPPDFVFRHPWRQASRAAGRWMLVVCLLLGGWAATLAAGEATPPAPKEGASESEGESRERDPKASPESEAESKAGEVKDVPPRLDDGSNLYDPAAAEAARAAEAEGEASGAKTITTLPADEGPGIIGSDGQWQSLERADGEVRRRVLALYDTSEAFAKEPQRTSIHRYLEMPLNRAGLMVDYADVRRRPLPDATAYRAIVVWFEDERMPKPLEYLRWLKGAAEAGTRVMLLNGDGAALDGAGVETPRAARDELLKALGLRRDGNAEPTANPFVLQEVTPDPARWNFETKVPPPTLYYERYVPFPARSAQETATVGEAGGDPTANAAEAADGGMTPWLILRRKDKPESDSWMVAVGPKGTFAQTAGLLIRYFEEPLYQIKWDVDPFALTEAAMGTKGLPRPDTTTVFGCRAAFSHIDGDGQLNPSIDIPGPARPAAEVVLEEVLKTFPVPVTVGLIGARIDPDAAGRPGLEELWRRVNTYATVQPGAHGYTHPLVWRTGRLSIPNVKGYTFDPRMETLGALEMVEKRTLPEGARATTFLWTGDCEPTAETVAMVEAAGIDHINGGNPRLDDLYASVSFVSALSRPVGRFRQTYAMAPNEYLYTNGWTENFGGFKYVLETFKRTETPRRLVPVNIYYHFYCGERQAGLESLQDVYGWALGQSLCWLTAAEYIHTVQASFRMRYGRDADGWWARNYGACRTLRFDDEHSHVDMERSRGVLGYTHYAGSLYITLAEGDEALFFLGDKAPNRLCLRRSTSVLREVRGLAGRWSARARRYAPGFLELHRPAKTGDGAETVWKATVDGEAVAVSEGEAGSIRIPIPEGKGEWAEVIVGP